MKKFNKHLPSRLFYELWQSPTLMTWGSFLTKTLSLIVILPLILTRFSVEEISLWYLFSTIIGLQLLIDIGFSPTFSRVIAYAMGGAEVEDLRRPNGQSSGKTNWQTLELICSSMHTIYFKLSILWFVMLASLGSLSLIKPISIVSDISSAWCAWVFIIITSTISLHGNIYHSYLQGINQIALLRRWEILFSLGKIFTSFVILLSGGGLLSLVIANQAWQIMNVFRNKLLTAFVEGGRFKTFKKIKQNREVLKAVWPSTWRSGMGIFMSYGLVQVSGIIYAQLGNASSVASYLLGLRLIQAISVFSQAPFYSKLPIFSRLFAEGKKTELMKRAKKGMCISYWSYVVGFILLGVTGKPLFDYIGSNADFPMPLLWNLLGLAFFTERYGAMHIQLYSLSNDIIWHIANGITGLIYIITSLILFKYIEIYAFPVGVLTGYIGFYSWYSAIHSYKEFSLKFFTFEKGAVIIPFNILLMYNILRLILK